MSEIKKFLEHKAYNLRLNSIIMTSMAGSGHPTSSLSAADLVAAIFFYGMHFDPDHFENPNNDHFILSKGHASPLLYAAWKELGKLTQQDLMSYRKIDSNLEGHPTLRFPYAEAATGSLGIGLSIGLGMAYAARIEKRNFYTYVLMGDSEITEGSIWEAAELAPYYKCYNLIGIIDCNRLGQSTETIDDYHLERYSAKFEAFGWETFIIDGHNIYQIMKTLDRARDKGRPSMIIAKTIKGYGIEHVENKMGYHGKPFKKEELNVILKELEQRFYNAAHYKNDYDWKPQEPKAENPSSKECIVFSFKTPSYKLNDNIPTRKVYGHALVELGNICDNIVSLDAEVKNSTYAEIFEKKHPNRFIQCFIAEQNMVGMAVGLDRRRFIPYVSTFGAFFSRAFDQIRMAAIGTANLRLVGSHAGISIGQDGPSQMALEDIAMMRTLPNSIVLYPSDAVSTYKLIHQMLEYTKGISYLRTTRMATPVIYDVDEEFHVGGCKILRQSKDDKLCIIGAGVTLFEALKAADLLKKEGVYVSVIDLYSIKPIDVETLLSVAQQSESSVVTVEDHYLNGGLGQAVTYALRNNNIYIDCLAVTELPRSGKPEELLAWAGIDADAIIRRVKKIIS